MVFSTVQVKFAFSVFLNISKKPNRNVVVYKSTYPIMGYVPTLSENVRISDVTLAPLVFFFVVFVNILRGIVLKPCVGFLLLTTICINALLQKQNCATVYCIIIRT